MRNLGIASLMQPPFKFQSGGGVTATPTGSFWDSGTGEMYRPMSETLINSEGDPVRYGYESDDDYAHRVFDFYSANRNNEIDFFPTEKEMRQLYPEYEYPSMPNPFSFRSPEVRQGLDTFLGPEAQDRFAAAQQEILQDPNLLGWFSPEDSAVMTNPDSLQTIRDLYNNLQYVLDNNAYLTDFENAVSRGYDIMSGPPGGGEFVPSGGGGGIRNDYHAYRQGGPVNVTKFIYKHADKLKSL